MTSTHRFGLYPFLVLFTRTCGNRFVRGAIQTVGVLFDTVSHATVSCSFPDVGSRTSNRTTSNLT